MKQLQKANIDEFKAHFRGNVLLPGDEDLWRTYMEDLWGQSPLGLIRTY